MEVGDEKGRQPQRGPWMGTSYKYTCGQPEILWTGVVGKEVQRGRRARGGRVGGTSGPQVEIRVVILEDLGIH